MVFADTAYFVALLVRRDRLRQAATEIAASFAGRTLVTTDAVLIELLAHVSALGANSRLLAARAVEELLGDPNVIVRLDPTLFSRALDLYKSRADKQYSLTDCMGSSSATTTTSPTSSPTTTTTRRKASPSSSNRSI